MKVPDEEGNLSKFFKGMSKLRALLSLKQEMKRAQMTWDIEKQGPTINWTLPASIPAASANQA